MDQEELNAIWHVLADLLREGENWAGQQSSEEMPNTANQFEPLKTWNIDYYRHWPRGEFKPGEVIQIEPPKKEVHASALWCKWDSVNSVNTGFWFYLGLWQSGGQFVVFRFEPPGRGCNHGYYHVQPCRTMGWEGDHAYPALAVPERNPTLPLAATSSLELLLCLVVSIHGMVGFKKMKERLEEDPETRQNLLLGRALDKIAGL